MRKETKRNTTMVIIMDFGGCRKRLDMQWHAQGVCWCYNRMHGNAFLNMKKLCQSKKFYENSDQFTSLPIFSVLSRKSIDSQIAIPLCDRPIQSNVNGTNNFIIVAIILTSLPACRSHPLFLVKPPLYLTTPLLVVNYLTLCTKSLLGGNTL